MPLSCFPMFQDMLEVLVVLFLASVALRLIPFVLTLQRVLLSGLTPKEISKDFSLAFFGGFWTSRPW